jgi:hypothetical protein
VSLAIKSNVQEIIYQNIQKKNCQYALVQQFVLSVEITMVMASKKCWAALFAVTINKTIKAFDFENIF